MAIPVALIWVIGVAVVAKLGMDIATLIVNNDNIDEDRKSAERQTTQTLVADAEAHGADLAADGAESRRAYADARDARASDERRAATEAGAARNFRPAAVKQSATANS